jgi:predicted DNA-binding protein
MLIRMVRKQLYIDDDLAARLKVLSTRTRRPEAEHVRAALRAYLDDQAPVGTGLDALEDVIGLIDDPDLPDDIAEHHDRYLYGAEAS